MQEGHDINTAQYGQGSHKSLPDLIEEVCLLRFIPSNLGPGHTLYHKSSSILAKQNTVLRHYGMIAQRMLAARFRPAIITELKLSDMII